MLSQLGSEPLAKFRASSLPFFLSPKIAHSYHKSRVPMNCEARQRFLYTPMVNHSWPEIYIELFLCGEALLFVQFLELVKVFISTCVGWMEITIEKEPNSSSTLNSIINKNQTWFCAVCISRSMLVMAVLKCSVPACN